MVTIWSDPSGIVWDSFGDVGYVMYQKEVCPTTGREHWQGWIKFKKQVTLKRVREVLPNTYGEPKKGTDEEAIAYCSKMESKVGETFIWGELKTHGARNDLVASRAMVKETGKMRDVVDVAPNYQSVQICRTWLSYHEVKRSWKSEVWWFWGPTGSGKSRTAMEMADEDDVWLSGKNLKWWEGYDGHKDVILDDFRGDFCTFHELLRILDRVPFSVECKGGSRQLLARRIFVTCPFEPRYAYKDRTTEDIGQLLRRIEHVVHVTGKIDSSDEAVEVRRSKSGVIKNPDLPYHGMEI